MESRLYWRPTSAESMFHNFTTDQVVVINANLSPQYVLISRGAYDIETIILMLNVSDVLSVRIVV